MKEIEELYALYKKDVYAYLLSLTKDQTLAEDLLSETFVKAILHIATFKGKSSVKTWLFAIARNNWLQMLRKEKKPVEFNDSLKSYMSGSIEDTVINQMEFERIQDLLESKDERTKMILSMRLEGYSFAEIAQKLNISESTARVIDFRTKQWLRKELMKEGSN